MDTLSNVVRKYLNENGISDKFFEKYIGCSQSTCKTDTRTAGENT